MPGIRRREFITLVSGSALARPLVAAAQGAQLPHVRVLFNAAATETEYQGYLAAFVQELRRLGWIEGQNLRIDVRWNAGDVGLSRIYAAQLIGLMPEVIVTSSTINLTTVRQATNTIPIVFVEVADPVTQGFVPNMRQPGGNITGFSFIEFSLAGKWLNLLKEIAPDLKRIGVIYNPPTLPYFKFYSPVLDAAAPSLGVQVIALPVLTDTDIEPAIMQFARGPNAGLLVLGDSFSRLHQKEIADLAGQHRLPSIGGTMNFAKDGGLIQYGPRSGLEGQFGQAATYVDRILRGAKPGDLPVQAPTKYELVINAKTAKALGLTVSNQLQLLADEVLE
jgi:putative ABC transport system substrate-binding protein